MGERFPWEGRASLWEDSSPRCFASERGMSRRAELSLRLFHAGVGARLAVPFVQLCALTGQELFHFTV